MARASVCFTGKRATTQNPSLRKNDYLYLMRTIKKETEKQHTKKAEKEV